MKTRVSAPYPGWELMLNFVKRRNATESKATVELTSLLLGYKDKWKDKNKEKQRY